ncbi:ASCH domain-containing protein [candidate division GN15 bacterium]|uniref:ASCH domain-containing protein n=1 Tax=candidate division GN15 bacterium TaxID=2072418 RepID=A0A855X5A4_9BACT|nr:MAG: ASCH domain-containing protein [candidate division GN15 bacterium]
MSENATIQEFWQSFVASLPAEHPARARTYESWHFCDCEKDANELGALVVAGIKTATCSVLWAYEAEGERIPEVGNLVVVTDFDSKPLCIIEITEVTMRPFNDVDASFAYDEGEGDRSLAHWRDVHWRYFGRELAALGRQPSDDMPLVCERFRVVWPKP